MPTIKQFALPLDPGDELVKIQVWVSLKHKRRILSAVGDDGAYTFVISHAIKQASDFIANNDIHSYDTASFDKFVTFICNRTDTRALRDAPVQHELGAASGVQHPDATAKGKPVGVGKGGQGGERKQAGKNRK